MIPVFESVIHPLGYSSRFSSLDNTMLSSDIEMDNSSQSESELPQQLVEGDVTVVAAYKPRPQRLTYKCEQCIWKHLEDNCRAFTAANSRFRSALAFDPIASGSSLLWRSSFGSYRDFLALIIISILVRLTVWYSHPLWYDILSDTTSSIACVVRERLIALHRTLLHEHMISSW